MFKSKKVVIASCALFLPVAAAIAGGTATVTFKVTCATDKIEKDEGTQVRITAKKGTKSLDDTHTYPKGSTSGNAVDHTAAAATAAGLVEGTDFVKSGNSILFKDVDEVDGGTGSPSQLVLTWSKTTGVTVGSAPPGGKVTPVKGNPDTGQFVVAAFGVKFSGANVQSTPSRVAVLHVQAGETAAQMMERFRDELVENGWSVTLEAGNRLHLEELPDGTPIATLSITPMTSEQMFPGSGGPSGPGAPGPERDHWKLQ